MLALITVLVVVVVSLIVTRVATVALMETGTSRHVARFQARSALSGTGFTTGDSESVVNHQQSRLEELDERGQGREGAAAASEARAEHAAEAEASGAGEAA